MYRYRAHRMFTPKTLKTVQLIHADRKVSVGDWVEFKCDIEQGGCITKITTNENAMVTLHLENQNGFDGDYIGGETETTIDLGDAY